MSAEVAELWKGGTEIGIVVGGGNIFRGNEAEAIGIVEVVGHQMGMVGTIINGLALQNVLENLGVETRLMSSVDLNDFSEPYRMRRALRHFEKGRVLFLPPEPGIHSLVQTVQPLCAPLTARPMCF